MSKKNFIYSLVVLCVILLLINVYIDSTREESVVEKPTTLNTGEIEDKFIEVLSQYNLDSSWTTIKYIDNKNLDSLKRVYYIKLPTEISIPLLINDVNTAFKSEPVRIEAVERRNYSNSAVKIYSGEVLKMEAFLNHDSRIARKYAVLSFYVTLDNYDEPEETINGLSMMNIDFKVMLSPGEESGNFVSGLNEKDIPYVVLLNDEMEDRFSIEEDDGKELIKSTIINLISVYGREREYIIDSSSDLYNSVIFSFIRDELTSRDIELIFLNEFSLMSRRNYDDVVSLFEFYCDSGVGKASRKLIVDYESFIKLKPLIMKEKKKGTKFSAK